MSEGLGYVTCSVLNAVQSISEQNSLSVTTLEREGYADRTAPLSLSPLSCDTMRRGTESVSDRDTGQSAKCRITKSSLETVKCRPVWDRACLYVTGVALRLLLARVLTVGVPDFMWEGSGNCDCKLRS